MFNISVNGIKVQIYPYDDSNGVLRRYSLMLIPNPEEGKILPTVPRYLRFDQEIHTFVSGGKYNTIDIRDELIEIGIENIENNLEILGLHYPSVTNAEIIILWLISQGYSDVDRQTFLDLYTSNEYSSYLKVIKRDMFTTGEKAYSVMIGYIEKSEEFIDKIHDAIVLENDIYNAFDNVSKLEATSFIIEEIEQEVIIETKGYNLYDIFNAIDVSENIPFIILVDKTKEPYYNSFSSDLDVYNSSKSIFQENVRIKVYNKIIPPDEWIMSERTDTGIYFYILNSDVEKLNKHTQKLNPDYSKLFNLCVWDEKGKLKITTNASNLKDNRSDKDYNYAIKQLLSTILGDRIIYNINHIKQVGVKGKFSIPEISFNKAVFADLIFNNSYVKYFTFLDESEKSALAKPKFIFYYEPNQQANIETSLTITVTPQIINGGNGFIDVRIARAKTLYQVNKFIKIFEKLCGIYVDEKEMIEELYRGLYSKITFEGEYKKVRAKKEDTKSLVRLKGLIKKNPVIFGTHYASHCQPPAKQPYFVEPNKLKDLGIKPANLEGLRAEMNKFKPEFGDNGLVNWPIGTNDWYACWPREPNEKDDSYIYAGVKERSKLITDNIYTEKYVPCCFKNNQYTKKSGLQRYLGSGKGKEKDTSLEKVIANEAAIDRPLGVEKEAPKGRYAKIPYNMQLIANSLGYTMIGKGKEQYLPLLRHGVINSPDSFVHCMEKATNENYNTTKVKNRFITTSDNDRKEIVANALKDISEYDTYTVGRQELPDVSDEQIRNHLLSGDYIDPKEFISIFEKHYGCNIILFDTNGEFAIPQHSIAYLSRKLRELPVIIINMFQTSTEIWPYQCELIVQVNEDNDINYSFDFDDAFVQKLVEIREQTNTVYFTAPNGKYFKYIPQTAL